MSTQYFDDQTQTNNDVEEFRGEESLRKGLVDDSFQEDLSESTQESVLQS